MTARVDWTPGWILHRRRYKDSGLMLDVLSREHGRIRLVARGGRGSTAARLQVFQPLSLSWSRRGELGTLTGCEAATAPLPLSGMALWCGFYVNELVVRLVQSEDDPGALYALYGDVLEGLAGGRLPQAAVLRHFEYRLLELLGYGFDAAVAGDGEPVRAGGAYGWHEGVGLVERAGGVPGSALLALSEGQIDSAVDRVRPILQAALAAPLNGQTLRTAAMLRQLGTLQRHHQQDAAHGD